MGMMDDYFKEWHILPLILPYAVRPTMAYLIANRQQSGSAVNALNR